MPKTQETTVKYNNNKTLNKKIIRAEKISLLSALPAGLAFALIAYITAPIFPFIHSLVIGIGTTVIVSILLFNFKFGKDLPKKIAYQDESPLTSYKSSGDNSAIQAYNRANGNPAANFIMPKKYLD